MTGTYQHLIDSKGRISVPSRLREDLGETFYVTMSMNKCLTAYPMNIWSKFEEKASAMPLVKQNKMRPLFANALKCDVDPQGRILLTQALRDIAGLKKNVTFVSVGTYVELWDSETWSPIAVEENTSDKLAEVLTELEF